MLLKYIGDKDFEIVAALGGKRVEPGDEVVVANAHVAKQLLASKRWEDAAKKKPIKKYVTADAQAPAPDKKKESDS